MPGLVHYQNYPEEALVFIIFATITASSYSSPGMMF